MEDILNFPLDSKLILRKKNKIRRKLLEKNGLSDLNIAILGGSTTDELKNILEIFLLDKGIKPKFYQSQYNKFYEDSVFENKKLEKFKPKIIYIHTSNVNINHFPNINNSENEINDLLDLEFQKFKNIWDGLKKYNCDIIQNNFDLPVERALGNLDFSDFHGKTNFINKLNMKFVSHISNVSNIHVNDINYLSSKLGLNNWFDKSLWYRAKYCLSFSSIPYLCSNLTGIINAILGKNKKCLVLDLDNTCWGGVIGDDGLNGIKLGRESHVGEAFLDFQNYVKELKERGVILAVSSKNNDITAKEGFSHSDSVLKLNDFTSFKANWDPKYLNINEIASEINIGLNSLVFMDDNPSERSFVRSQLPDVSVPEIGNDILNFTSYIEENNFFEIINLSNDDLKRSKYYSDNNKRFKEELAHENYKDFLKSLNMNSEIEFFKKEYLDRITQLVNKTNQFNLTTKRYTINEIESIFKDDSYIPIYGKLSDKFGDNGLVSVIICKISGDISIIECWLMSCRVIKREMEYEMFNKLVDICKLKNIKKIRGLFYPTSKNNMVSNLFSELGFDLLEKDANNNTSWELTTSNYNRIKTTIKINK